MSTDSKWVHRHHDADYHFCSEHCLRKFKETPEAYSQEEKLSDPVCGMAVTTDSKHQHKHGDKIYYFCCNGCLTKFKAAPEDYVGDSKKNKGSGCCHHDHKTESLAADQPQDAEYFCPMCPEVSQIGPGACPSCGMALEPKNISAATSKTEYTCPMHPEVVQDHPGACPKCGMALESRTVEIEEDTSELDYMSKHFWVSAVLAIPVLFSAMAAEFWPEAMAELINPSLRQWLEMIVSTPVIVWGGWVFYVRAIQSVITRNLNMFTLIGLGVSVAYAYSIIATVFP
ncbi:MAG: heavy metal-binding domain-containing protein, partial [Acidiferrobacterales bacterium]